MIRTAKTFLKDILTSMELIEEYIDGKTLESFAKDQKTVDAVVRNIEIIGEATKQIPDDIKGAYKEVPWNEMARMRDKMIHGYFTIAYDILWETAKHDIPDAKPVIRKILEYMD